MLSLPCYFHDCIFLDKASVNTGCIYSQSQEVPGGSRMANGRFSPFTLDLYPAKLNPSAFLSSQGHHLHSQQRCNGVGNIKGHNV